MNEIQTALADSFADILTAVGVPVTVNGVSTVEGGSDPLTASLGAPDVVLEDDEAGFIKSADIYLKFLVSHLPTTLPTYKATIVVGGEAYAVTGISRKPDAPVIQYDVTPA